VEPRSVRFSGDISHRLFGKENITMSDETVTCEFLSGCAFFNKYKEPLGAAYDGFVALYCNGPKLEVCKRRQYRIEKGEPPAEDMLPNGAKYVPT
jgi:hypothetical protein